MRQKEIFVNRAILKDGMLCLILADNDLTVLKKLSTLHNCKYRMRHKRYEVPLTWSNVVQLSEWQFMFGKSLRDWERTTRQNRELKRLKIKNIPGLNGTLYPYQARGVEWIDECGGRALIADEMGLGKTIQALGWMQLHPEKSPTLVLCPSILKINWEREAKKWLQSVNVQILESRTPYEITGDFVIINYDVLDWWVVELKEYGFQLFIVDEAHYIKSNKAKRTKAFKRLAKYIPNMIALTGTPIENKPIEIFNIVQALDSTIFPDYIRFTRDYCDATNGLYGWNTNGASNTQELYRKLVNSVMIRRKKTEVLTDLPDKQICVLPLEITNRKEYAQAEERFIKFLAQKFDDDLQTGEQIEKELKQYAKTHELEVNEELTASDLQTIKQTKIEKAKAAPALVQMGALKQLAVKGKMAAVIDWIKEFLETDEKLVVFAINKKVIAELMKHFPTAARVDGSVTKNKRQKAMDRFQTDPACRLFVGNIDAAGIGITLTAASNAAIIQFPWSPGKLSQAADRIHRISQTKRVTIWNIVGVNTIEEKIIETLAKKEKIMIDVLDGGKYDAAAIASEVIKMYKK